MFGSSSRASTERVHWKVCRRRFLAYFEDTPYIVFPPPRISHIKCNQAFIGDSVEISFVCIIGGRGMDFLMALQRPKLAPSSLDESARKSVQTS